MNGKKLGAMALSVGAIGALAAPIAAGAQSTSRKNTAHSTSAKVSETCIDGLGEYGTVSNGLCISNNTLLFSLLLGGLGG